jgi:hypothetical protein
MLKNPCFSSRDILYWVFFRDQDSTFLLKVGDYTGCLCCCGFKRLPVKKIIGGAVFIYLYLL